MTTKDKNRFDNRFSRMRADQERLREEIALLRKENRRTERALNQREALVHSLPAGLIVLEKARIVEVNEFILTRLGYSIEDLASHPFAEFVHPRLKNITRDFQRRRASGKWAPEEYETDLVAKNGEILSCDVKVRKVRRAGRTAFLLMLTPSQERRRREKELVEAKKRESLRRMALEITRRCIPLVEKRPAPAGNAKKGKAATLLSTRPLIIEHGNEGILEIARALESYTREALAPSQKSLIDLRGVVRQAVANVGPKVNVGREVPGSRISLKTYLRNVPPVEGDPGEIEEMLLQVVSNAIEAMPQGGDLYLSTEENAGYAHIYVQDSGVGIDSENLDKLLDPFFTTKEGGRPGLGLCVAHAIARRHKGTLDVSSKMNEGTVVTIRLPLSSAAHSKGRKKRKVNEVSILLVEEDMMTRDLLHKMLDHKGYRVSAVTTGSEALQQVERKPFDLVIVGSGTPAMDVQDLISEMKKKKTGLKVAWIARGETGERKSKGIVPTVDLLIRRPIDMTSTLAKLSELLAD